MYLLYGKYCTHCAYYQFVAQSSAYVYASASFVVIDKTSVESRMAGCWLSAVVTSQTCLLSSH